MAFPDHKLKVVNIFGFISLGIYFISSSASINLHLSNEKVSSFQGAKNACAKMNLELLSIPNKEVQLQAEEIVNNMMNLSDVHFFIDMKKNQSSNFRSIVNGEPFPVKLEGYQYKNNFLLVYSGLLASQDAQFRYHYLCQKNGSCPDNSIRYIQHEKLCFERNHHQLAWYEARADCLRKSYDLATNRILEIDWANDTYIYWLGFSKVSWSTSQTYQFPNYTNWEESSETQITGFDCVLVGPSFTWRHSPCEVEENVSVMCTEASKSLMASVPGQNEATKSCLNRPSVVITIQLLVIAIA